MTPNEWLQERVLVTDAEAVAGWELARMGAPEEVITQKVTSEAFRRFVTRWNAFIVQMQPGDELWWFKSPRDTWASLCGRAGFAIVRNGTVVHDYTTWLN